ncbi:MULTISPECIES: MerR family transcriptional regulator [Mesobacillus]|uniref:MerR family transcriptional regulator n=1 Tax=Mesobacillus TaxID=2675231 RepID=UPI00178010D6|nr:MULTISPECIES: MerR family DNA-binding transcriptional regulator [Mesobacillus]MCM3574673.1 MerR family DNA-binding transcriptional regulator [Mesobacillus subterraneus]UYZ22731.1 MerR family DNA-binding transcriptional regulator [Mesobacillus jeotgali]
MLMFTISDLAKEFGVSTRTIRYYEELGLLQPSRTEGGRRIYTGSDVTRLKLVFRGKRFGFSLDEIKEMVLLFDEDRTGEKQLKVTIQYGEEKLAEVNERICELVEIREEIERLLTEFKGRLSE